MSDIINDNKKLSQEQADQLLLTLKERFEKNMNLHKDMGWDKVQAKLEENPKKLWSLYEMERKLEANLI